MASFAAASEILGGAVLDGAFPACAIEVGTREGALWRRAFGSLTYDAGAPPASIDTIFDLASLTKVLATTTLTMRAVDEGRLSTSDPVSRWIPAWRGRDREEVTIADLLAHASGLTAYLPFFRDCTGRIEFERAICSLPLEYRAADTVALQRSRLHPPRLHPRGGDAAERGRSGARRIPSIPLAGSTRSSGASRRSSHRSR